MIRLMHGADLHLDTPFAGLSPEKAAQRRAEQRALLQHMAEECNRLDCDILLLSGDLFDGTHVYRDTIEELIKALGSCRARVFISPGNHDCLKPGSPYLTASWPENVHIFKSPSITSVCIEELGCRVYGAAFLSENSEALLESFSAEDDGLINLMVLHGDTQNAASQYNPISRQQIASSGLHYLALGHIHKGELHAQDAVPFGWPGCMMGRGFDETGEKGVFVGTVSRRDCSLSFLPMGGRRYEIREVEAGADPLQAVLSALPESSKRDIVRIVLTGESEGVDIPTLLEALGGKCYSLTLRDRTTAPVQLWAAVGQDTLKGLFLADLKQKYEQANEADRPAILYAARTGLALLEGREVPEP